VSAPFPSNRSYPLFFPPLTDCAVERKPFSEHPSFHTYKELTNTPGGTTFYCGPFPPLLTESFNDHLSVWKKRHVSPRDFSPRKVVSRINLFHPFPHGRKASLSSAASPTAACSLQPATSRGSVFPPPHGQEHRFFGLLFSCAIGQEPSHSAGCPLSPSSAAATLFLLFSTGRGDLLRPDHLSRMILLLQ